MDNDNPIPPLTRAEIDLNALAHNFRELRRVTSKTSRIMAVVKADGYGHGAVKVSQTALANGADFLAVARISEAAQLRQSGINAPILLFGYCSPAYVDYLSTNDIRASINSLESARALSDEAVRQHKNLKSHIKIDTGMGRLGLMSDMSALTPFPKSEMNRTIKEILDIARMPGLQIEGIYTHFARADSRDKTHALSQFNIFMDILTQLKKHSFEVEIRHAANSAATIEMPETHLDMVRPGIALYGLWPSNETDREMISLKPVMSLKSCVIHVKEVPAGFKVSYGCTWESVRSTKIATIPLGYADGYERLLSSKGSMLVRGQRVPVVGTICMDLTMLDVGCLENIDIEDEVVIIGKQGDNEITADEIAGSIGTINYEIVSSLAPRVPRIYI
ncbi:MAG TPA: alanine racemase [Desulfomonilia bacterium]